MSDYLGGIYFPHKLWAGPQILGWFLLFAGLVVCLALLNIRLIKVLALKRRLNSAFVGGIILSLFTSLPELLTGFYAGYTDRIGTKLSGSVLSLFNILGANSLQTIIIVFIGFYLVFSFWKQRKKAKNKKIKLWEFEKFYETTLAKIAKNNLWMWTITMIEYVIMITVLFLPDAGQWFNLHGFNLLNGFFFLTWFFYLFYSYYTDGDNDDFNHPGLAKSFAWKLPPIILLGVILLVSGTFAFSAYLNSAIVDQFPDVLHIPQNFAGTFLLSLTTSLPEIITFASLLSKKLYITAASGILGSSVFNLSIPFYTNLVSLMNVYGNRPPKVINVGDFNKLLPSLIWSLILYSVLGLSVSWQVRKRPFLSIFLMVSIIAIYFIGLTSISEMSINS